MTDKFTAEELKEVIRAACIFNSSFSEEQFQSLIELEARLADSGYLQTVSGLRKLEKEKGVPLSQVLETHDRLLGKDQELEQKVAARSAELEALEGRLRAVEEKYQKMVRAIQEAAKRLEELRREQAREETALAAFRKKAAREKERIDNELAEYRQKADVTEAEVAIAGQVKAEVAKHGYTLELALGLAQEFAGYTNARDRLAAALKKEGTLTSYLAALEGNIKTLDGKGRQMQSAVSRLAKEQEERELALSQLKAEIAEKGELVGFYHRYVHLRPLIEYLGSWNHLTFHHCLWCGALFWVLRPGNVPTGIYKCPWCGLALVEPDKNAYATVAQPPSTPLKLLP
jgi:DNA repair exonuclease SbcCD ATPase subunit